MKLALDILLPKIVDQYNFSGLACPSVWVYLEIIKDMPGIKKDGRIANDRLAAYLANFGYAPVSCTPSLWKHYTLDISFALVVDNFGIKYVGKQSADHLIQALLKLYTISID